MDPELLITAGLGGLFIAAFLAGTIIPFSSEVVAFGLIYADFDPVNVVAVASAGNILGGITTFEIGRLGNERWIMKWFRIREVKLEKWKTYTRTNGVFLALFSWVPIIGNAILLSLGLLKSPRFQTVVLMSSGKIARYIILVWIQLSSF